MENLEMSRPKNECVILNSRGEMMGYSINRWVIEYPDAILLSFANAVRLARQAIREYGHGYLVIVQNVDLDDFRKWIVDFNGNVTESTKAACI